MKIPYFQHFIHIPEILLKQYVLFNYIMCWHPFLCCVFNLSHVWLVLYENVTGSERKNQVTRWIKEVLALLIAEVSFENVEFYVNISFPRVSYENPEFHMKISNIIQKTSTFVPRIHVFSAALYTFYGK